MKKITKILFLSVVTMIFTATMVFASPVSDLQAKLIAAGVPSSYVGNVVEYLQKNNITQAQANSINGKIDEVITLIGDTKDLSKLPSDIKIKAQSIANEAASSIGLKVTFSKNAKGETSVAVTDSNSKVIIQASTSDVITLVTNFKADFIKDAVTSMVEFSNNPDKGNFHPVTGELTNTASNYGNTMVFGVALLALAGTVFFKSKKAIA